MFRSGLLTLGEFSLQIAFAVPIKEMSEEVLTSFTEYTSQSVGIDKLVAKQFSKVSVVLFSILLFSETEESTYSTINNIKNIVFTNKSNVVPEFGMRFKILFLEYWKYLSLIA